MSVDIVETLTKGIIEHIQDKIGAYLNTMYAERDKDVTMENPIDYFDYEHPIGYRLPCVIVLPQNIDYRLSRGPNHISALVNLICVCVCEDRKSSLLQKKVWRYQDALKHILDRTVLEYTGQKNIIRVTRANFSQTESQQTEVDSLFRKEVLLTLEVEHYENE